VPHKATASEMRMVRSIMTAADMPSRSSLPQGCMQQVWGVCWPVVVLTCRQCPPLAGSDAAQVQLGRHAAVLAWPVCARHLDQAARWGTRLSPVHCKELVLPLYQRGARPRLHQPTPEALLSLLFNSRGTAPKVNNTDNLCLAQCALMCILQLIEVTEWTCS
jgi:hypothetical protein